MPSPATPVLEPDLETAPDHQVRLAPQWHVILLDDDHHTYDYVIEMLMRVFDHSLETAFEMAVTVDTHGQVIVDTTTKERAELKQEQVHAYGPDWRIPKCAGAMSCIIEPACE